MAALLVSALLSACQTVQPPPDPATPELQPLWQTRLQLLSSVQRFALKGRIASSSLGGGSADLSWRQDGDQLLVTLSGTFGVGALRIEGTPDRLSITTRDGQYQADAAEQELQEKLGAPLPVADLRYWVLGMPRPDMPAVIGLDEKGRLGQLDQEGWHLDYLEYRQASDLQLDLPYKLWLSCGSNRWKVVVDQWSRIP